MGIDFTGALGDNRITFAEAQQLKAQYKTKAAMAKALVESGKVSDPQAADKLASMVMKADKMVANGGYTYTMKAAAAIEFVDGNADGKIASGELSSRKDALKQAKAVNEARDKSFGGILAGFENLHNMLDGNQYLSAKDSQEYLSFWNKGNHADFGTVKAFQAYVGAAEDGKIGKETIDRAVVKGRAIAADGIPKTPRERVVVEMAFRAACHTTPEGLFGIREQARAIMAKGGPKTQEDKEIVGLARYSYSPEFEKDYREMLLMVYLPEELKAEVAGIKAKGGPSNEIERILCNLAAGKKAWEPEAELKAFPKSS